MYNIYIYSNITTTTILVMIGSAFLPLSGGGAHPTQEARLPLEFRGALPQSYIGKGEYDGRA